jgi:hypothetical protein
MKNKTGNVLRRLAPLLILVISFALLLAGCMHLNQFAVEEMPGTKPLPTNETRRFDGLQAELAAATTNNQTLRLLIVHGMGISEPGYSASLVDRVAAKLNLNFISQTSSNNEDHSVLTVRDFGNGPSRMCAYELTWSPITTPIKTSQFALDFQTQEIRSRQLVNNDFKTNLVDCALSDVVLYVGKFRPTLQHPIIAAIEKMELDSATNDDPVAIITHSLASFMVIDTLKTMAAGDSSKNGKTATNYATRVKQIFMMANQLPMLDLSDHTNFDGEQSGMLSNLFKLHGKGPNESRPKLQVVAFSDPNDLLSFNLRQHDIKEAKDHGMKIRGFNVNYTVEHWSIAGVLSWPAGAHDNWWTDKRVPELLAFGHEETQRFKPPNITTNDAPK